MAKKKILLISESVGGGMRKHIVQLLENLDSEKFEIFYIHGEKNLDSTFIENYENLKKKCTMIPCSFLERKISFSQDLKAFRFINKQIKLIMPDVVHCHSSKAGVVGRFAAKFNKVEKIFYTPHAYSFLSSEFGSKKKSFFVMIEKMLSRYMTTMNFCVSSSELNEALRVNIDHPKKFKVIYNGLPEISFPEKKVLKKSLGLSESFFIVGNNARMTEQKNPILFFKIAEIVINKDKNVHFVWVGNGPLFEEIKNLVTHSSVSKNIHLLGERTDSEILVAGYDLYLTTSLYEGLPYSVIEAMRANINIIGTNVVGHDELIRKDALFNISDPITASELILRSDIKNLESTRSVFEDKFTLSSMINSIEKEYLKN
ncbi:glycosyltransferase [Enterococcus sp. DIV0756]|uniref:glycosyltransferase n=1 Tax=Enterococcus sp. DIV0756 TaxID=2774636 RepID=UPI003F282EF7